MRTQITEHMAVYENGDYSMCDCAIADVHNIEETPGYGDE